MRCVIAARLAPFFFPSLTHPFSLSLSSTSRVDTNESEEECDYRAAEGWDASYVGSKDNR